MENRYFKDKDIDAVLSVIVGTKESQRPPSKDGFWLVKLKRGDNEKHKCLEGWEEIKDLDKETQKEEWL